MIEPYERFKQEVREKLGSLTAEQWREQNPGKHMYATYRDYVSCAWCGRVKPHNHEPGPCPGLLQIGLREIR